MVCNEYTVSCYKNQGKERTECKDVEYTLITGDRQIYSLADGITAGKYSAVGARRVQETLGDFLANVPEDVLLNSEKVKKNGILLLKNALCRLAEEEKTQINEFSSTLMMLVIQKKTGIVRWIHIGDGMIFKVDQGKPEIVSRPRNGITSRYTYVTTSMNMERHFRTGIIEKPKNLGMMTDGAAKLFYKNREFTEEGKKILSQGINHTARILEKRSEEDDQSIFWIQYMS